DYACHRCIYYPAQPKYVYYYNPVSKKYWGRFDVDAAGYSLLEEKDRAALLADVPESAFPKPGPMPAIPGSKDGPAMDRPPKELPEYRPPSSKPPAQPGAALSRRSGFRFIAGSFVLRRGRWWRRGRRGDRRLEVLQPFAGRPGVGPQRPDD